MTPNTPQKCPSCGAMSAGKFCNECGTPLAGGSCANCGAKLSGRSKFCAECGSPSGQAGGGGLRASDRTPWIIAAVSVVAFVVTLVVVVARSGTPTQQNAAGTASALPDLNAMSPREAADRLFDHVARAEANGDTAQIAQFAPMALQAYALLEGDLDPDARLHIGLIHLATRNTAGATAEADTILRGSGTHLFGLYLRIRAAEAAGNTAASRRALQAFAAAYQAERAKALPEYGMHEQLLVETKNQADGGAPTR